MTSFSSDPFDFYPQNRINRQRLEGIKCSKSPIPYYALRVRFAKAVLSRQFDGAIGSSSS